MLLKWISSGSRARGGWREGQGRKEGKERQEGQGQEGRQEGWKEGGGRGGEEGWEKEINSKEEPKQIITKKFIPESWWVRDFCSILGYFFSAISMCDNFTLIRTGCWFKEVWSLVKTNIKRTRDLGLSSYHGH